jgi:cysteine desulfurase
VRAGRYDGVVSVYLDSAASTLVDPRVREVLLAALDPEIGNAGSRTHDFGRRARRLVEEARFLVASVVDATRGDVIFTSGATEANNLALLGLAAHARATKRRHLISTQIEHHAVLEPLRHLARDGFDITLVPPEPSGRVSAARMLEAIRPDTLLISVMHVNNETGIIQPIETLAEGLAGRDDILLHVDAAQGYGKLLSPLRHARIDLMSVSGHKIGAPQGIGALISRRRGAARAPLAPLTHGGGQERGLRPGTLPVALIAAFGRAAELCAAEHAVRDERCRRLRVALLEGLGPLRPSIHGDPGLCVPHIINLSFPGLDAETVIDAWRDLVAISNGAACTSAQYVCSHVLSAMRMPPERMAGAVRLSWQHDTPLPEVDRMVAALAPLTSTAVNS